MTGHALYLSGGRKLQSMRWHLTFWKRFMTLLVNIPTGDGKLCTVSSGNMILLEGLHIRSIAQVPAHGRSMSGTTLHSRRNSMPIIRISTQLFPPITREDARRAQITKNMFMVRSV